MNDHLILVDENDKPLGKLEKLMVHQLGLLHRAFSVFIFNSKGELLLQQRADENIIPVAYGQTPVAVIRGLAKKFHGQ